MLKRIFVVLFSVLLCNNVVYAQIEDDIYFDYAETNSDDGQIVDLSIDLIDKISEKNVPPNIYKYIYILNKANLLANTIITIESIIDESGKLDYSNPDFPDDIAINIACETSRNFILETGDFLYNNTIGALISDVNDGSSELRKLCDSLVNLADNQESEWNNSDSEVLDPWFCDEDPTQLFCEKTKPLVLEEEEATRRGQCGVRVSDLLRPYCPEQVNTYPPGIASWMFEAHIAPSYEGLSKEDIALVISAKNTSNCETLSCTAGREVKAFEDACLAQHMAISFLETGYCPQGPIDINEDNSEPLDDNLSLCPPPDDLSQYAKTIINAETSSSRLDANLLIGKEFLAIYSVDRNSRIPMIFNKDCTYLAAETKGNWFSQNGKICTSASSCYVPIYTNNSNNGWWSNYKYGLVEHYDMRLFGADSFGFNSDLQYYFNFSDDTTLPTPPCAGYEKNNICITNSRELTKELQRQLKEKNCPVGAIDGSWGNKLDSSFRLLGKGNWDISRTSNPAKLRDYIISVEGSATRCEQSEAPVSTKFTHVTCRLNPRGDNYLSLRTGRGGNYRELRRMGPNTRLKIISRSGRWLKVQTTSRQTGWASSKYICRR